MFCGGEDLPPCMPVCSLGFMHSCCALNAHERIDRTRTPLSISTDDMHRAHIDSLTQFTIRTSRALAHKSFPFRCLRFLIERRF